MSNVLEPELFAHLSLEGFMKRYPRSFLQLVTLGYVLVVIPFLFATGYVFVTLEILDGHYRVAIDEFSETSRLTVVMTEDLIDMERSLRRYEILRNADSLNDYALARKQWQGNVESFSRLFAKTERVANELQSLTFLENRAYVALGETQNTAALRSAIDEIKLRLQKGAR